MKRVSTIKIDGQLHQFDLPKVMGILNVTPDSFYAGSRTAAIDIVLDKAAKMIEEGAWCLDIGGYSSRPGADDVSPEEELKRVLEPIKAIREAFPNIILSIDTFRTSVARTAIENGADIINDISGGQLDDQMTDLVVALKVPYIGMHMRGTPQTMKTLTEYEDLISEMIKYFSEMKERFYAKGLSDLIIDPGFGFAKNIDQNFEILNHLEDFHLLECPMLIGLSRKSMIFKTLKTTADEALNGTTALNTLALLKGADILRVHDVKPAVEVIALTQKVLLK